MAGKCCLTCGFASCLDACYNGSTDNIPPSAYYPNPFDCAADKMIPDAADSCALEAEWNN